MCFSRISARIRPGLRVQITSDALPGVTLRGAVNFIEPQTNPDSRTTPVRIQVENPGMRLEVGMFVRVQFQIPLGANVLTVPRSAVIDTGTEKIVYLALPDGVFQRRTIQTGPSTQESYGGSERAFGRRPRCHQWRISHRLSNPFDRRHDWIVRRLDVLQRIGCQ